MKTPAFFLTALASATLLLSSCESNKPTDAGTATTTETTASDSAAGHDHDHMAGMDHSAMNSGAKPSGMMAAMHAMMTKMDAEKMAGNTDHDFAHMMMAHHQGAVDMAALELKEGKDATLRALAEKISTDQKRELQALEQIATRLDGAPGNYKPTDPTDPFTSKMKASMDGMMKNMGQPTGNIDQDFALLMIPHHQSAIDMAQAEIAHGRDTKLKEMAQQMITEQKKEVEQLKAWQAKNAGPQKASAATYVCPMNCEGSQSSKPGKCPTCGMDLEKKA